LADMKSMRNRKIGAIAVAVVALAGVGTAYAASQLHSSPSSRSTAPGGGGFVAPGRGQQFGTPSRDGYGYGFGGGRFGDGPFGGRGLGFGGVVNSFTAAAGYLGLSQQQLFSELRSGKTLAQIANATSGKSASGLIDAMVTAQKSAVDSAVKSGRITRAMANQIEAQLKTRVTDMVNNGIGRFGGRGGFGGGRGFGTPPSTPPSLGGSSPA
jgi:hypothetical protein